MAEKILIVQGFMRAEEGFEMLGWGPSGEIFTLITRVHYLQYPGENYKSKACTYRE